MNAGTKSRKEPVASDIALAGHLGQTRYFHGALQIFRNPEGERIFDTEVRRQRIAQS